MAVTRFKTVTMFLLAVLFAMIFWGFLLRAFAIHHSQNPIVQGLAGTGIV